MEIRELKSFAAAARLRSVSRAAEQLQLGQPTVTTHIKKLENEMGVSLFDRVKRPIQLTLAGETLAQLVTPLIEGIDSLAVRTLDLEEEGPVTVASTPDIIPHTMLRAVTAFRTQHPRLHLRIRSRTRFDVLRMVSDGEADLGVMPGPDRAPELEFEPLFVYERVLITPLGHPLLDQEVTSLDEIAQYPLILMARRTHTRDVLESEFRRRGLPYEVVVELDSMDMIKRYVASGVGISVGPRLAIDPEDVDDLGMVSMANLLPVEQAGILTLQGKALSTPARRFIDVMRESFASGG
jgi:DNA-binding transcriptional LysR family regulator